MVLALPQKPFSSRLLIIPVNVEQLEMSSPCLLTIRVIKIRTNLEKGWWCMRVHVVELSFLDFSE